MTPTTSIGTQPYHTKEYISTKWLTGHEPHRPQLHRTLVTITNGVGGPPPVDLTHTRIYMPNILMGQHESNPPGHMIDPHHG